MRNQTYLVCRDYLQGSWKTISAQEMILKHISGGLSNHLYYCALPPSTKPAGNEPNEVLVRFYGQVHGEDALESLMGESVIFALLSERRLGPRLYGVFPGGRIEQYIPARSLTTEELADPQISSQIAVKMARLHALHVPISKEPSWIWDCMERWIKSSDEFLKRTSPAKENTTSKLFLLNKLRVINFDEELSFIRRIVNHTKSPVIFSHNDMQEGNILIRDPPGSIKDRISLIDFEYCSYNYRGFDISNHFCEWMYSYKVNEEPYFKVDKNSFPNKKQQLRFIRSYFSAYELACDKKNSCDAKAAKSPRTPLSEPLSVNSSSEKEECVDDENISPDITSQEEKLLQEIRVFEAVSHLMWSIWSIVQAHVSKISFGYLEYAVVRMEHYVECKKCLKREDLGKRESSHISSES